MSKAEERSAARDFVMARLAAARGQLSAATGALDDALILFVETDDDRTGKKRAELIEAVDASIAEAARGVQLAMSELDAIDPKETEPEPEDDEDEEEDDDEDDDDED